MSVREWWSERWLEWGWTDTLECLERFEDEGEWWMGVRVRSLTC